MTTTASQNLRVRQRLGKYRIERRLGEGGFATVFQAMDTIMGTRVALKIPHAPLVDDDLLKSFRREAKMVEKLEHPGILPIRDASIIDDRLVIVFALGKETLNERVSRRMSFESSLAIIGQLIDAIAMAHRNQVIHCDIKPENVIMFDGGVPRLADFGIAKVARQTVRGRGTGTVGYMAPEQAMGRPSSRSDVFSMGLIAYRMLAGVWPEWPYEWPMDGSKKLKTKVHPQLIAWLKKSIAVNPRHRYADAGQMQEAYEDTIPAAIRFIKKQRGKSRTATGATLKLRGRTQEARPKRRAA